MNILPSFILLWVRTLKPAPAWLPADERQREGMWQGMVYGFQTKAKVKVKPPDEGPLTAPAACTFKSHQGVDGKNDFPEDHKTSTWSHISAYTFSAVPIIPANPHQLVAIKHCPKVEKTNKIEAAGTHQPNSKGAKTSKQQNRKNVIHQKVNRMPSCKSSALTYWTGTNYITGAKQTKDRNENKVKIIIVEIKSTMGQKPT